MNFLAHALLSFGDPELLTGNIISDFVKGKRKFDLPRGILAGIELHRAIDRFTDDHPENREARKVFHSAYRLYSASILDIVYDHFVANRAEEWISRSLEEFVEEVYSSLDKHTAHFPPVFQRMFPYMRSQNWLFHYKNEHGIFQSLNGLKRRATYIAEVDTAYSIFLKEKETLRDHFNRFYPELKAFAAGKAIEFSNNHAGL